MVDPLFISVVIPVHNRAHTINKSLLSVLSQSYSDFEVIVVDDCSTDETVEIIRSVGDERVSIHCLNENHGAAYCRNYGANIANGTYIAFQDSDDIWRQDKLLRQVNVINRYSPELCISRFERNGYRNNVNKIAPGFDVPEGWINLEQVVKGDLVGMPTVVVKRQEFVENPFDPVLRWCEDYEWSIRFCKKHSVYLLDDVLVDVYLQENSVTRINTDKQLPFYQKMFTDHEDVFDSFPWFHADVLGGYAKQLIRNGKKGDSYYLKAFHVAHRPKDLVKYMLSRMGLIQLFLKED